MTFTSDCHVLSSLSVLQVSVTCPDLGLTQLPATLPTDTIYLDLSNNKVNLETELT